MDARLNLHIFVCLTLLLPMAAVADPSCTVDSLMTKVCVSDVPIARSNINMLTNMKCDDLTKHPGIASEIRSAFELSPQWFRDLYCRMVVRIPVAPVIDTSADYINGKPVLMKGLNSFSTKGVLRFEGGSFVGFPKERLEVGYGLYDHFESMLRQAGKKEFLEPKKTLPKTFGSGASENPQGAGVLALLGHEMGHVLSTILTNGISKVIENHYFARELNGPFSSSTFGFISWADGNKKEDQKGILWGTVRAEGEGLRNFTLQKDVSATMLDTYFRQVHKSGFVSPFAMANPIEDFAETFSYYVMAQSLQNWNFQYLSGETRDLRLAISQPTSSEMVRKVEFIAEYLKFMDLLLADPTLIDYVY